MRKQSYSNQAFLKADRFISKVSFPHTWLNKAEHAYMSKSDFKKTNRRHSKEKSPQHHHAVEWAKNSDISKMHSKEKLELGDESNEFAEVKVLEVKDFNNP